MNLSFANGNGRPGHFVGAFSGVRFMTQLANATFAERAMRLFERSACERRILCGNYLMFAASLFEDASSDDAGAWMERADATVFDADQDAFRGARETRQQLVCTHRPLFCSLARARHRCAFGRWTSSCRRCPRPRRAITAKSARSSAWPRGSCARRTSRSTTRSAAWRVDATVTRRSLERMVFFCRVTGQCLHSHSLTHTRRSGHGPIYGEAWEEELPLHRPCCGQSARTVQVESRQPREDGCEMSRTHARALVHAP